MLTGMETASMSIQGLLEFLAAEPFYHGSVWTGLLEDPYRKGNFAGAAPLMALLPSILLRRTQQDVRKCHTIPPLNAMCVACAY